MITPPHTSKPHILVDIIGASGSSGRELVRLLCDHPVLHIRCATSRAYAGQTLRAVDPAAPPVPLVDPADLRDTAELVFTCLPHGAAAETVQALWRSGARVVDLSADFRLRDDATHDQTYGSDRDPEVARAAVYGLTEVHREAVAHTRLVANPGCYPTCSALALLPLVRRGWARGPIVLDAKSGVSGAGSTPTRATMFTAVVDDVRPYSLGRAHRHTVEIEQVLADMTPGGGRAPSVIFNPHVVPVARGMLVTAVVHVPDQPFEAVVDAYRDDYRSEALVDFRDGPVPMRAAVRTPGAVVGVSPVAGSDRVVVTCAIDNLGKGAAAQAVQNANRMLGMPETLGLRPQPTLTEVMT